MIEIVGTPGCYRATLRGLFLGSGETKEAARAEALETLYAIALSVNEPIEAALADDGSIFVSRAYMSGRSETCRFTHDMETNNWRAGNRVLHLGTPKENLCRELASYNRLASFADSTMEAQALNASPKETGHEEGTRTVSAAA